MYDREIEISVMNGRKVTSLRSVSLPWSEFVKRLQEPIRGAETVEEYSSLPKARQDELKDVGGFVGGTFRGNRRKLSDLTGRDILTLDLDNIPPGKTDEVLKNVEATGYTHVIYSTRKHTLSHPRLRIVILFNRTATPDEYEPVARKIASQVGIDMCDPTTFEASRLMYWPSCSQDSEYVYISRDGVAADVDQILAEYTNWRDVTSWPGVPKANGLKRKQGARQADPRKKPGIVGAFCRAYDVVDAIEKFIPEAYVPTEEGRYTFAGGSTASGAVVYDDGLFLYSHHATDPAGGRLCNAFDLVRLHKFSYLDEDTESDVPIHKLPSYGEMFKLVTRDSKVLSSLVPQADTTQDENSPDSTWMQALKRNENLRIATTVDNMTLILCHDPKLSGKICLDLFSGKLKIVGQVPWDDEGQERSWSNSDTGNLVRYLEKVYGIYSMHKFEQALVITAKEQSFNPVKEYLESLSWDGKYRLDTLLVDYMGAEDNIYTRMVTRKALTAAVARIMTPGVKYDNMLVLIGKQGRGKTTLFHKLGGKWFSNSLNSFEGKEAIEGILGKWIHEIGELQALNRSEMNAAKNFMSRTEDTYRAPYAKHTETYPRQCVFFGTTNTRECLRDATGGRRFWPVDIDQCVPKKDVFTDLDSEVDQIWAEAYERFRRGESLHLTKEIEEMAHLQQEAHREENPLEGLIREFIERPIPKEWMSMPLIERRLYWSSEVSRSMKKTIIQREFVCALEIWCECLDKAKGDFKQNYAREINQILSNLDEWEKTEPVRLISDYGIQRGYRRKCNNCNKIVTDEKPAK